MDNNKVFITGINGFTGQFLNENLSKFGYKVYGGEELCQSKFGVKFDITNSTLVEEVIAYLQPNFIFHLAAKSAVTDDDLDKVYLVNTLGTDNVIKAAKSVKNLEKIIFASSAQVYGNHEAGLLTEEASLQPVNHYAVSKLAAEKICYFYTGELPIIIARPFNYTGLGQSARFVIPKIVDGFKNSASSLDLGNINVERDFSDVRDIVDDYRLLMQFGTPGEAYNICSGRVTSLRRIFQHLENLTGNQMKINVRSHLMRVNEVEVLGGSREKLDMLMGKRTRYDIEETIEWMYSGT